MRLLVIVRKRNPKRLHYRQQIIQILKLYSLHQLQVRYDIDYELHLRHLHH